MRAVDTNVLVRLITRDDPKQALLADQWIEAGAWVSQLALAEMTWVLSSVYDLAPAAIHKAVTMLLDHRNYLYAASVVVMMTGLVAASLAIPSTPEFVFATPQKGLVQYAGGSSAY